MDFGFNFNNLTTGIDKNTSDYPQIISRVVSLPMFALDRSRTEYVLGKDGGYTVKDGKSNKTIVVDVKFISKVQSIKMAAMRSMAAWLNGSGELILNFDTSIMYEAELLNEIPISKAHELDEFTLVFDVKPFSQDITPNEESITLSGADSLVVNNPGTAKSFPLIKLNGTATSISIAYNGKTLTYTGLSSEIVYIDTETYEVYDSGIVNKIGNLSGTFFDNYFIVGDNNISITGTALNLDVTFTFKTKYL